MFVGRVLRDAIDQGIVKRDEVVVVTKLGHTAAPASAQARDTPPLRTLDSVPHGTICNVQRRTAHNDASCTLHGAGRKLQRALRTVRSMQ